MDDGQRRRGVRGILGANQGQMLSETTSIRISMVELEGSNSTLVCVEVDGKSITNDEMALARQKKFRPRTRADFLELRRKEFCAAMILQDSAEMNESAC